MVGKLTPEQYAESARQLGDIIDEAVGRHNDEQRREFATPAAMHALAGCCREVIVQRPANGPDLGAILISHQFKEILGNAGMVVMPLEPNDKVRGAFKKGWFRSFTERYRAAVKAVWA
ncbi:hypothetical protein [Bradyrhizobium diazoefficiens]|uniref:hypothetical protein n=1 Tax=Bradyrhizobium diazoefficiens TaxID=1355477 RepID=UPI00271476CA|nr:hypothetical protein [Bradyrhizobium diazoefficiens]WLA53188.1 hypothetical protein QIH81_21615 [Bradyrhizobium diazoefficiens]